MMLIEQTPLQTKSLPISEFKEQLRMHIKFTDAVSNDESESFLRSAITYIEARTGKILIERQFVWTPSAWDGPHQQVFPVSPVNTINAFHIRDRYGALTLVDVGCYGLQKEDHQSCLTAVWGRLPTIPVGGRAEVFFEAGLATTWGDLPDDTAYAVLMLAVHFYENRNVSGYADSLLPYSVSRLIKRCINELGVIPKKD